jgi:hypothetical protein
MKILFQTFEGEVRTWFKGLPPNSIDSSDALEYDFLRQWGEKNDHVYFVTKFANLKKKHNGSIPEFIKMFNKLYNNIPTDVKPSQPVAKVIFVGYFDPYCALLLRERSSTTLTRMKDDAMEIESNMIASGKARVRKDLGDCERRNQDEQLLRTKYQYSIEKPQNKYSMP